MRTQVEGTAPPLSPYGNPPPALALRLRPSAAARGRGARGPDAARMGADGPEPAGRADPAPPPAVSGLGSGGLRPGRRLRRPGPSPAPVSPAPMEQLLRAELRTATLRAFGSPGAGCISEGRAYDTDAGPVFVKVNRRTQVVPPTSPRGLSWRLERGRGGGGGGAGEAGVPGGSQPGSRGAGTCGAGRTQAFSKG